MPGRIPWLGRARGTPRTSRRRLAGLSAGVLAVALVVVVATLPGTGAAAPSRRRALALAGSGRAWVANFSYDTQPGRTVTPVDLPGPTATGPVATGSAPSGLAVAGTDVLVANRGDDSLAVVDAASRSVTAEIHVGVEPRAVAVSAPARTSPRSPGRARANLALVANFGGGTLTPVNLTTLRAEPSIPVGPEPNAVAVASGGSGTALVAGYAAGTLTPVDLTTLHAGTPIPVGPEPSAVAVVKGPGGSPGTALVTDFGDDALTTVQLPSMTPGPGTPLPGNPTDLAVQRGGATAWVTCGRLLVPVALPSLTLGTPIRLPGIAEAVALSAPKRPGSGPVAWVAQQDGWVVPVALRTGTIGAGVYVGGRPSAIVVSAGK